MTKYGEMKPRQIIYKLLLLKISVAIFNSVAFLVPLVGIGSEIEYLLPKKDPLLILM